MTEEEQANAQELNRFLSLAAGNKFVQERASRLTERAINDARTLYGAGVTAEQVLGEMREVRLASMGDGTVDESQYSAELANLNEVAKAVRAKKLDAGLNVSVTSSDELLRIKDRAWRIAEARRLNLSEAPPATNPKSLSDAEKVNLCLSVSSPAERLALARRLGLKF